jgi:hypothetical protein
MGEKFGAGTGPHCTGKPENGCNQGFSFPMGIDRIIGLQPLHRIVNAGILLPVAVYGFPEFFQSHGRSPF